MARAKADPVTEQRKRRSSDLRVLAESLLNAGACDDISPLLSAAYQCVADTPRTADWAYDVSVLRFRVNRLAGSRPLGTHSFAATLSVSLSELVRDQVLSVDPFVHLAINVVLTGTSLSGGSQPVTAAWHFDRHVGLPNDTEGEIHPRYHVQYGGREMHDLALGHTMLSDAPRLLYPPMDAVLAVDFVVSNYRYDAWVLLRDDASYNRLIAASYERLWRPWFSCIGSYWGGGTPFKWEEHKLLCPTLPEPIVPTFARASPGSNAYQPPSRRKDRKN
jgi:hypothetical protein